MLFFSKNKNKGAEPDANANPPEANTVMNGALLIKRKADTDVKDRVLGQMKGGNFIVCNPNAPASLCQNILLFGRPKSGKTSTFLVPSIRSMLAAGESVVISDPGGEILDITGKVFKLYGYNVKVLNFIDFTKSHSWSPLGPQHNTDDIDEVQNRAKRIARTMTANAVNDPTSNIGKAIEALITAVLMVVCMDGNYDISMGTCCNIIQNCQLPAYTKMLFSDEKMNGKIRACLGPYKIFEAQRDRTPADLNNAIQELVDPYTSPEAHQLLTKNDFDFKAMATGQRPCAYFIVCPKGDHEFKMMSALFIQTALETLMNIQQKDFARAVNFVVDGLDYAGQIGSFDSIMEYATKYNMPVRVLAAVQSVNELIDRYPDNWKQILLRFTTQVGLGFSDATTAKYYAALSAAVLKQQASTNKGLRRKDKGKSSQEESPYSAMDLLKSKANEEYIVIRGAGQIKCNHRNI